MLRDARGSEAAAGADLLDVCQSALRECTRQEKTVALTMLLTLQAAVQVGAQLVMHITCAPYQALSLPFCSACANWWLNVVDLRRNSIDHRTRTDHGIADRQRRQRRR